MIEISHKQAQHLIREGQDRRLPEEQWAVLYAHLEDCSDCRAYRQRLNSYEKDMGRLLRTRWSAVRGPGDGVVRQVLGVRERRKKFQKFLSQAWMYFLGLLLIIGYAGYRHITAPPVPPTPTPEFGAGPANTSTPIPLQGTFRGLTAFESRRDGNAEIYLLNASFDGVHLTNLTQNPAQDTQPVWSPDGEWIAFLSDRSGKNEVYVIHVAGSRLTQVTNAPQIAWSGPLQWSYDGRWLGLSGRRGGDGGPSFVYLVAVDGSSEPRSLAYTNRAGSWLRFSPSQPALAFLTSSRTGGLDVVNTDTGWTDAITQEDNQVLRLVSGQGGAFDWSLGGGNLIYTADAEFPNAPAAADGSQIRMSPAIQIVDRQNYYTAGAQMVDSVAYPNHFRAVSWVPHSLIVAGLVKDDTLTARSSTGPAADCWVVRLKNAYNASQSPRILNDVCVTGGLDRSNWTPDGTWLVVIGREPGETVSALYALRVPEMAGRETTSRNSSLSTTANQFERLADIPQSDLVENDEAVSLNLPAEPRVRPGGQLLHISPKAALPPASTPAPVAPPAGTPGWIVYSVQRGSDSWIIRSRPDGSESQLLTRKNREHTCPRISPDGKLVAFLSDQLTTRQGVNEVNIVGIDGKNAVQLTHAAFPILEQSTPLAAPLPRYDCPVWSPDGKLLAAVHRTANQLYLAVIPVDGKTPTNYLLIEDASTLAAPIWIPKDAQDPAQGANQILLVYPRHGLYGQQTRLMMVEVGNSYDRQPAVTVDKLVLTGWDDVNGMALSADGQHLAMMLVYENLASDPNRSGRTYAALRVTNMNTADTVAEVSLPRYDPAANSMGTLSWLPDGKLALARIDGLVGPAKTVFERFDPLTGRKQVRPEQLARFEDLAYHAVWIEGRWAVFTAESGLWGLNLDDAQANRASAVLLSGESVSDLDWR